MASLASETTFKDNAEWTPAERRQMLGMEAAGRRELTTLTKDVADLREALDTEIGGFRAKATALSGTTIQRPKSRL